MAVHCARIAKLRPGDAEIQTLCPTVLILWADLLLCKNAGCGGDLFPSLLLETTSQALSDSPARTDYSFLCSVSHLLRTEISDRKCLAGLQTGG